jgi:hypothetical protein
MDALTGRRQTTRGVWLSAAAPRPGAAPPLTLVLDLEGSDGRERGEDDASESGWSGGAGGGQQAETATDPDPLSRLSL